MSLGGCPTSERSRRTRVGVLSLAFLLLAKEISKRKPRLLPASWVSSRSQIACCASRFALVGPLAPLFCCAVGRPTFDQPRTI